MQLVSLSCQEADKNENWPSVCFPDFFSLGPQPMEQCYNCISKETRSETCLMVHLRGHSKSSLVGSHSLPQITIMTGEMGLPRELF